MNCVDRRNSDIVVKVWLRTAFVNGFFAGLALGLLAAVVVAFI